MKVFLSSSFVRLLVNRLIWIGTLGCFVLLILLFRHAGWYLSGPADTPVKADVIVALGGGAGARIVQARRLYAEGYAPRVLLTGLESGATETRQTYLNWRVTFLIEKGMPREAIFFDLESRNTWEEAANTRLLMEKLGLRTALVVSDPPHIRRLAWVWSKVFVGSGLEYRLVASSLADWDPGHWWRHEPSAQFVLMELIKLCYYAVIH
jgi:uncharacterized SAM-binding protein YcdF (DUF218 family)